MNLSLREPQLKDKDNYLSFLNEWQTESAIVPKSACLEGRTYEAFIRDLSLREKGLIEPERLVPDLTYILVDEDNIIYGALNLRLKLNDYLLAYDGHIGYGIAPSKRQMGYGKLILKLGLKLCKKRGIKKVLVTCNEENIASEGIIKSQGRVLENVVWKSDGYIKRYWITIN